MKKFYPYYQNTFSTLLTLLLISFALTSVGQDCSTLNATFKSYESRCAATGSIKVTASGGSGSYKYRATGPVNTNFTSTDSITGLEAGTYSIEIKDISTNCTITKPGVVVSGNYQDIRFSPVGTDISCEGGQNGSISLSSMENGRAPFAWTIMAPSAMGEGTSNSTGNFTNLIPGDYRIRMTDSCGGIQTRIVTIHDYTWVINAYSFTKSDCNTASGYIKVTDSKNNISTVGGIPGFQYGIVRAVGDTFWSSNATFTVSIPGLTSIGIVVKDACGKVKTGATPVTFIPSIGPSVTISNKACGTFTATVTSITNMFYPSYILSKSGSGDIVQVNSTGTFNNVPYGDYCIKAVDGCTNAEITRCFSVAPPALSIGNTVAISNKNCTTFTATITSKVGLTSPTFYLYNSASVLIATNSTGIFNSIPYGDYSIVTKDGCRDTTITRFFGAYRWKPKVNSSITPSYMTCDKFGVQIGGDSLTAPNYCLYDDMGTLLLCNATGIFDSLSIGSYEVRIKDGCIDTTIIRNFSVTNLTVSNDVAVNTANTGCNAYTATVSSNNIKSGIYTLYTAADVVVSSNTTGIFTNIPAGSYYVLAHNLCPDTTFKKPFTITRPVPAVANNVTLNTFACSTFTATITGQTNLTSPQYCLYDNADQLIKCQATASFSNLSYGSYCIKVVNSCYDTVITRCFTAAAPALNLTVTSTKSCTYGNSDFKFTVSNFVGPYNIKVYNNSGFLLFDQGAYFTSPVTISNVPGIVAGQTYKFLITDNCGKKDSVSLIPQVSSLSSTFSVQSVCPGDLWPNGSGKINADIQTNMGSINISIIKKNGATLSPAITPTGVSGTVYTFDNLEPATYIVSWKVNDACGKTFNDTVVVDPYTFPTLKNSMAYQCDVNGFTVGAAATKGVAPFTYEIIGSFPSSPSIVSGEQFSPLFNIDNGTDYSLIRLRALDNCGNATLGDVSILPLADNKVTFSANCFAGPTTLKVDPLYNSNYQWYHKKNKTSTDSTLVSIGSPDLFIPALLPSDTGVYVCHISVAGGCISRTYTTRLDGSCYMVLSNSSLKFSGRFENEVSRLTWTIQEQNNINSYSIERRNERGEYEAIGTVNAANKAKYEFTDLHPENGLNYYRLKLNYVDQKFAYSNIVALGNNKVLNGIRVYPNPVTDQFTVDFAGAPGNYKVVLMTLNSQVINQQDFVKGFNTKLVIKRDKNLSNGLYLLRIIDINTNTESIQKIIFK